jgi:predicted metal-dependent hydrolase
VTNKQLRQWFRRYNRKYFGGKLPEVSIRFEKMNRLYLGWSIRMGSEWTGIEIAKTMQGWPKLVRCILLHEMVHVSLPTKLLHGPRFEKEMLRLAKAGAFRGIW